MAVLGTFRRKPCIGAFRGQIAARTFFMAAFVSAVQACMAWDWSGMSGSVVLPAGDVHVRDVDAQAVSALSEILLPDDGTRLIFETPGGVTVNGTIHGAGRVVVRGDVTLGEANGSLKVGGAIADHYTDGGFVVESGTLALPQSSSVARSYPAITLGEGATLLVQRNATTNIRALNGSGTVMSESTDVRSLNLGFAGDETIGEFSGRILGDKIKLSVVGHARLLGRENTNGGTFTVYRNSNSGAGAPIFGTAEVAAFGRRGDASSSVGGAGVSVDLRFSGYLTYLGEGEATDRNFAFRYLRTGQSEYPVTLDAGAAGGIDFTGAWEFATEGGYVGQLTLTGSNAMPCRISGEIKENDSATFHVAKKGTGTWRFLDGARRGNKGGIAVEEGTLQFDSIAEAGTECALGLATRLYRPYQGEQNEGNAVDYAYLLGGATTNVVFEYTGSNVISVCSTRPIALKGGGAYLRSSAIGYGKLKIAGVSALADGDPVKTLYLDGSDSGSVVCDVSDGAGAVGVTKVGPGTWTLAGDQTFSGPLHVGEGTLKVAEKHRRYTWFRFLIKGTSNQVSFISEIGLFDKDGNRIDSGLAFLEPLDRTDQTAEGFFSKQVDYRLLRPGEAVVGSGKELYYYNSNPGGNLFDGTVSETWRMAWKSGEPSQAGNWIPIVWRLPDGANEAAAFDLVPGSTQTVTAFTLEGSVDGSTWHELLSKESYAAPDPLSNWASDNSPFGAGEAHMPGSGWRFKGHEGEAEEMYSQLVNVSGVSVAAGATLMADGEVTLRSLSVDCAAERMGTIIGFTFAKDGKIALKNLDRASMAAKFIHATFMGCTGLENLSAWQVVIGEDARPIAGWTASVSENGIQIAPKGLRVIIK